MVKLFPRLTLFWRKALECLAEINYECTILPQEFLGQMVWFNSDLRIGNIPFFDKKLYNQGLKTVCDIVKETGKIVTLKQFMEKFETQNYLVYYSIRRAFPRI